MNDSTNQDIQRLKQMLEEVTAADASVAGHATSERDDATSLARDAEIASLREAWLAFEQLIRAADAALPAMANVATSIGPQMPHRRRWIGLMTTAAVALLVAIPLGWWMVSETKTVTPAPVAKQGQPQTTVVQAEKAAHKTPPPASGQPRGASPSAWDDPLETQIVSVSRQIRDVGQNWQHRVDDVDLVQYRIDEVTASLQNDAL